MARYEFTSPDGQRFEVNAPEEATEQQVMSYFQQNYQAQEQPVVESPEEKGFIGRVGEAVGERVTKTREMVDRRSPSGDRTPLDAASLIVLDAPGTAALAVGQAAGAGLDIIGEGVKSGYKTLVPKKTQEAISGKVKNALQIPVIKKGIQALNKGADYYSRWAENNPDSAMALEGVVNVSAFGVSKGAAKLSVKETTGIVKDVGVLAKKAMPGAVDNQLYATIKKGIDKSIRPGVEGKRTFSQATQFYNKSKEAVETIVKNKTALKLTDEFGDVVEGLPKSLQHFSQAIDQTKSTIFKQYDDLAKGAKGAIVDTEPISRQLKIFSTNKTVQTIAPEAGRYADELANRLSKIGKLTAVEAQQHIQALNSRLNSFYNNPSYGSYAKVQADLILANSLRKKLDKAIGMATGKEYQALKKQYGALKAIERDVNRRSIVDARKNVKGLVDSLSDVASGAQAVHAITSQSPAMFASAATVKGLAKYTKWLNDPNTHVKRMFSQVDDLLKTKKEISSPFKPVSTTGKAVKKKINALSRDVEKLNTLKKQEFDYRQ